MVLDVGLLLNGTAAHLNTPPHADTPGASTFRSSRSRAFNPATTTVTASTSTPALVLATQQPIVVEPMEEEAMPILMTSKRPRSPSFDRRDGGLGKAKYRSRGPAQSSPTEEEEDQVVPDSQLNQWTATIWPASQQRIGFSGDSSPPAEQQQVHENHVTQSRWPESEQAQRSPKEDDDDDDDERVGPHLDDSHDVETSFETDQDDFDANFSPSQYALPNPHSFMSDADAETAAHMDVKADEHRYTPSQRPIEHDEDHSDVEGDSVAGDPHYHGAGAAHGLDDQTEREDDVVGAPAAPETVNKFTQMGFSEWLNAGDDLVARLGGIVTRFQEIQRTKQAGRQKLMDRIEAHKRALEAEDGRITNLKDGLIASTKAI